MRTSWRIVVAVATTFGVVACDGEMETDAGMVDAGNECTPACDADEVCMDGECVPVADPCDACDPDTEMCVDMMCVPIPPCGGPCPAGQHCDEPTDMCVDNVCEPACAADEFCDEEPDGDLVCRSPLARASRSTTIDINFDNTLVAMVNPDNDTISVFQTSDNARVGTPFRTGDEPSSIVFAPDGTTVFVANQADHTIVRVRDVGGTPTIDGTIDVGSEPTGIALTPTGTRLYVAEWAQSRVSVIGVGETLSVIDSFSINNPYAIAVTNNGDINDLDERVVVTEFYGRPNANSESSGTISNDGRTGIVQIRDVDAIDTAVEVALDPISTGFAMSPTAFANQLFSVNIQGNIAYVTSINAAPERPNNVTNTVYSVIYPIDLTSGTVVTADILNLPRLVDTNIPTLRGNHMADTVAVDFISNVAYSVARAADAVQRLDLSMDPPGFGISGVPQVDLDVVPASESTSCQMPTGIVTTVGDGIGGSTRRAFVNCRVTRQLGVIDLVAQRLSAVTESEQIADETVNNGMRFYFTSRGRWSADNWSSCGSCHPPPGLSDNVTWRFGFGPRQTTSMDGSFSHPNDAAPQEQRLFNWTANFDEMHDFERNTRGTSGGLGAVTGPMAGMACGATDEEFATEQRLPNADGTGVPAPLGQPIKEIQDMGCTDDWDEVDAFIRQIRPPRGRVGLDPASVMRGRDLFAQSCANCHGGGGWTVSERFWDPSSAENANLANTMMAVSAVDPLPAFTAFRTYDRHIQAQPTGMAPNFFDVVANSVPMNAGLTPPQAGCAIRNVGTFGIRNMDAMRTLNEAMTVNLEQREGNIPMTTTPNRALGGAGHNVPSLYGLQVGAPYLHHGTAETLEELLDPAGPWSVHALAMNGTPGFLSDGTQLEDMINFLLSIDAETDVVPVPDGYDVCVP